VEKRRLNDMRVVMLLTIILSVSLVTEATSGFKGTQQIKGRRVGLSGNPSYQVSVVPAYVQEGLNATLFVSVQANNDTTYSFKINVTNPAEVSHIVNISVITNATGFGENSSIYWGDFSGAHTNLVGVYNVALKNATTNETLHSANLTVGLTDKFNYRRNELVQVRGSGYNANENVTIDIETNGSPVASRNMNASIEGIVNYSWRVPVEAALGVYSVDIVNATTPGTVKAPSDDQNFTVFGVPFYSVFPQPDRIQEGLNTTLTVTLRDAAVSTNYSIQIRVNEPGGKSYNISRFIETNGTGFGSISIKYWGDFGAHTNLVGTYTATINETLATANFTVGLADKTEYRRGETVLVQAAGYGVSEVVTVNMKIGLLSAGGFPVNHTADGDGRVTFSWKISLNATPGTYNLTLASATSEGTVKTPFDTQNFEVLGVICRVQTKNLADDAVGGVSVEVYNTTAAGSPLIVGNSTVKGMIIFNLDEGNYTFKALWKGVQVGNFSESITADKTLNFTLQLTDLRILVRDATGGLPLIALRIGYNYTTRANVTKSESMSLETNISGVAEIDNMFVNLSYVLEGWRFGFSLPGTPLKNETLSLPWNIVVISVPTYTTLVQVFDSKGSAVSGIRISAYGWITGTSQPVQTQLSVKGNVTFLLTFGKYLLRAFYDSLALNETALDLIEDNFNFTFHLATLNTDFTIQVRDYFGQPVANANVTVERKIGEEYFFAYSQFTGADGSATFASKVGGDSRISIYVGGKLVAVKTQFLSGGHSLVDFQVAEYVAILGYPIPTGLFALLSFILVLAVVFLVLARGRLMKAFGKKLKR